MYLPTDNLKTFMEQNPETYKGIFPEQNVEVLKEVKDSKDLQSCAEKLSDKRQNKK